MEFQIPFNRPSVAGKEHDYMAQAINGGHLSGDGPFTFKCQAWLEQTLNVPKTLLTTSCTHALEMAARLLNLAPGDEVIVPSFTFVSTVNAFVLAGAKPVFADIRPDTLNLDEARVEDLITPRTQAIVPVHYAGVGCEMDAMLEIASNHNLQVIEDNAHGLLGKYKGKLLGTFGVMATQSFHETKNFQCGEGGALLINDDQFVERAEIIREKGTNRRCFLRGQIDKYSWVDVGSSYLPSDLLAAFLFAQFEMRDSIQAKRRALWHTYRAELQGWADTHGVRLPIIPEHCEQAYHMFYLVMPSLEMRTSLIDHLKSNSILAVFHYVPLHLSPMGQKYGGRPGDCAVTEDLSDRLVRLPFFHALTESEQGQVIDNILAFPDHI